MVRMDLGNVEVVFAPNVSFATRVDIKYAYVIVIDGIIDVHMSSDTNNKHLMTT